MSQGGKEYLMRAHFGLPSVEAEDKEGKPPISVKFEIPYFTTSGIQVGHTHTYTQGQTCFICLYLGYFIQRMQNSSSKFPGTWPHSPFNHLFYD